MTPIVVRASTLLPLACVLGVELEAGVGFRFRKSFRIGSGRINLSKSGIGMSVGGKGFRVGAGPGGAYSSGSIPGTGLLVSQFPRRIRARDAARSEEPSADDMRTAFGCLGVGLLVLVEFVLLVMVPRVGFAALAGGLLIWWLRARSPAGRFKAAGKLVSAQIAKGNFDAALKLLDRCEESVPGMPATAGLRGQALYSLGRFGEAVPYLKAGPQSDTERLMLAECLRHTGAFRESLTVTRRACRR